MSNTHMNLEYLPKIETVHLVTAIHTRQFKKLDDNGDVEYYLRHIKENHEELPIWLCMTDLDNVHVTEINLQSNLETLYQEKLKHD